MSGTLAELLDRAAASAPGRTAVEDPERGGSVTYDELAHLTEQVRAALARHGVGAGDRVGVAAPKAVGTVAALLGILRAGAAYVPVDPAGPLPRAAGILQDAAVRAVVAGGDLAAPLAAALADGRPTEEIPRSAELGGTSTIVPVDRAGTAPPAARPDRDDVAYILYTSGSTGRPKGVVHTHASARSFVDWCSDTFGPRAEDRFSSHAPFHFDLSILDLYVPLAHAAALVLIPEELGKQPPRLAQVISERRISVWYSTPSILRLLVEFGRLERHPVPDLRLVLFAGEVFPVRHLRALQEAWPAPRYVNLYGPTETNVCTWYEVPRPVPSDRVEPYPIGRTCPNDRTRVVDPDGRDVPDGEEGELIVSGGTLMRGYWNLPQRTAEAFLLDADGTAWYRTGDVVRRDDAGDYVFLGRRDRMVKRRGYRVELGEIEAALHRHPGVREAAVVAVPDEESGVRIHAYLGLADGEPDSAIPWKRWCAEVLPGSMVPDRFTFVPSLPRTSTDKVDYPALRSSAEWTSA